MKSYGYSPKVVEMCHLIEEAWKQILADMRPYIETENEAPHPFLQLQDRQEILSSFSDMATKATLVSVPLINNPFWGGRKSNVLVDEILPQTISYKK